MLVHQLIKVVLDECVLSFIDNHFIVMTLQICLTLVFSVLITIVVTNYIPFIIGKKIKIKWLRRIESLVIKELQKIP